MRTHLVIRGFVPALVFAACAPAAATTTTPTATTSPQVTVCAAGSGPHHAYVVVEHLSGASSQQCVAFSGDVIDGQTLMDRSGVEYSARSLSSGKVVCQVDNEPKTFSQCFPQNKPYWALFVEVRGVWSNAAGGYADVLLHDGEAMGWHYVPASDPSPAPPPLARPV